VGSSQADREYEGFTRRTGALDDAASGHIDYPFVWGVGSLDGGHRRNIRAVARVVSHPVGPLSQPFGNSRVSPQRQLPAE
jgi:hypothetical protein